MTTKREQEVRTLVDEFGKVKEKQDKLNKQYKALRQALIEVHEQTDVRDAKLPNIDVMESNNGLLISMVEGDNYIVTMVDEERTYLDNAKIRADMPAKWLEDHENKSPSTRVKIEKQPVSKRKAA